MEGILMRTRQSRDTSFIGHNAAVIGASMAGLLAGRVLSDYFEHVTIIERDQITEDLEPRKGVPQGRHVHVLLKKGANLLSELFPNFSSALIQDGAPYLDSIEDVRWHHFGVWKARFPSDIRGYSQSRPLLEKGVRDRVAARANVHFIDACEVTRLCANNDNTRVTGVQLRHRNDNHREEELTAELVVDASGRGSQASQWLMSLGYGKVKESIVKVDIGYASRIYRRPSQTQLDWKALVIYPKPPGEKRGGYVVPIEDDFWIVTLVGWLRDYPPDDETGFLNYACSLPVSNLYEAIKDAEPVTPIVTHKFPANRWRHYEQMSRFPEGFVILGDAACSFNPIYGQGMTTAALEASMLSDYLYHQQGNKARDDVIDLTQHIQQAIAKVVKFPWLLATSEDFRYPATAGMRPTFLRLLNWYVGKLHVLVSSYPVATIRFYEVVHMLKPPTALFEPRILFAVLFKRRVIQRSQKPDMNPHQSLQHHHLRELERLKQ
jgi:2-polyprenyl-6-methoxyphenol hydroxylase-like FAD-dependent oxidoreductase